MKHRKTAAYLAESGIIAALYVILTVISSAFGLSSGAIQFRISESLCILPCFCASAVPGLFIGCLISNLISGCLLWDVLFGSLATLAGAVGTRLLRRFPIPSLLPPIIANTITVPLLLMYVYQLDAAFPYLLLTVGIGELVSCGLLGSLLYVPLKKAAPVLFRS